ncbi:MAG TPA: hypothetical protein VG892_09435 [Terriglobales bacterium]|nr:hypothetical protein [Terriglobales bacterium]
MKVMNLWRNPVHGTESPAMGLFLRPEMALQRIPSHLRPGLFGSD